MNIYLKFAAPYFVKQLIIIFITSLISYFLSLSISSNFEHLAIILNLVIILNLFIKTLFIVPILNESIIFVGVLAIVHLAFITTHYNFIEIKAFLENKNVKKMMRSYTNPIVLKIVPLSEVK